ncbi:MAG: hypothetical protein JWM68_5706 [Verrucomicrobiales bacterium]|nr:hypothetical protein [Verrucomicrobiales bacterium]
MNVALLERGFTLLQQDIPHTCPNYLAVDNRSSSEAALTLGLFLPLFHLNLLQQRHSIPVRVFEHRLQFKRCDRCGLAVET